jgi:hypothetical protein
MVSWSPPKVVRFNDELGQAIDAEMQAADALLLGRRIDFDRLDP